jgi:1-deoxy-D-xylulose-5-phosphate reductoisomerase
LNKRIRFDKIHDINRQTLDGLVCAPPLDLQDLLALDAKSRQTAAQNIARLH